MSPQPGPSTCDRYTDRFFWRSCYKIGHRSRTDGQRLGDLVNCAKARCWAPTAAEADFSRMHVSWRLAAVQPLKQYPATVLKPIHCVRSGWSCGSRGGCPSPARLPRSMWTEWVRRSEGCLEVDSRGFQGPQGPQGSFCCGDRCYGFDVTDAKHGASASKAKALPVWALSSCIQPCRRSKNVTKRQME